MSMDRLIAAIKQKNNPTVAGLDPTMDYIPAAIKQAAFAQYGETLAGAAEAIWQFNKGLIDALCDVVPAVKPQSAYYEMYGPEGVGALAKTIAYAQQKGMYVIADVKRNDIGSTAEAYAKAYLGKTMVGEAALAPFGADSATVNPYLGTDGIAPFLQQGGTIFVLVKTSNPSSGELQDLALAQGGTVYEHMAGLVEQWGAASIGENGYSNVGAVVGATYPAQLAELRGKMPHTCFLVPGYGAQGGKAADVAKAFDANGLGAVINASRSILCAYQKQGLPGEEFARAARAEAIRMRDEIISFL